MLTASTGRLPGPLTPGPGAREGAVDLSLLSRSRLGLPPTDDSQFSADSEVHCMATQGVVSCPVFQ